MAMMTFGSVLFVLLSVCGATAWSQTAKEPPPAQVQVAPITLGRIRPVASFLGTVTYPEIAAVASEMSGLVETVHFEEGQRVAKNAMLITLNADLLRRNLEAASASHQEAIADLEKSRIDYQRIHKLFKSNFVAEQSYDEIRFRVRALENKAASLKATMERLQVELEKKVVYAPFDGVILQRYVDRGEWVASGAAIASIARDDFVDVMVDVPQKILAAIAPGTEVRIEVGGGETSGRVFAVIPRGDVATRTFPIKVRIANSMSLIQGMEARVSLPSGNATETLLVPRDAVLSLAGQHAVYTVVDAKAHLVPVKVVGFEGMYSGIEGDGLREGMVVVIKGNERLREGQPLHFGEPS